MGGLQRLVFGEVARSYDDVRAGYPAELGERIFAYAGGRFPVVEVGAGTGKATAIFVAAGVPVTCVEPDPAMAEVLTERFGSRVRVEPVGFEDWRPPAGGVPLICASQSWHWVDPGTRWRRGREALRPGGVLAVFGHSYTFADADLARAVHEEAYGRFAPQLLGDAADEAPQAWFHVEMAGSGLLADVTTVESAATVAYPRARYRRLLETFSNHRMPEQQRLRLHDAIDEVVDGHGGVVEVRLDTVLTMGRRPVPASM